MRISKPGLLLPLVLLLGCPGEGEDGGSGEDGGGGNAYCDTCNLDYWLPALGDGAMDCGFVELGEDPGPVAACVEDALESGAPFMARQQLQGIDSRVELGFVVDLDGVVQQVTYDSNICGASTCEEGCGPFVSAMECRNARPGATPEQALVDCDAGESASLCEPPAIE